MNDIKTYYYSKFREDIDKFFSTIPDESRFHEDRENKQIYSIQYERLTPEKEHLDFMAKENKEYFGVALFFTVLTDMVCYTYYKDHYDNFFKMTRCPKLIGNCLSMCHYHLHPREIFYAMNYRRKPTDQPLLFTEFLKEAIETMRRETLGFFQSHLKEINGIEFWKKCESEFPFK